MKREDKKLHSIIKKLKGNVLVIGIEEEELLKAIHDNPNITKCNMLNAITSNSIKEYSEKRRKKNFEIKS